MKLISLPGFFAFLTLLLFSGCNQSQNKEQVEKAAAHIKSHFIPDQRVEQFNIEVEAGNPLLLTGETTLAAAKQALLDSLTQAGILYTDSVVVLPADHLGEKTYGLVNNSVSNIRSEPRHSAQLATQALLGMPLQILKKEGGWYYVRTPDDYLSWVDSGGMHRMNKSEYLDWKESDKIIYLNTYGFAYLNPDRNGEKVGDLTAGNILRMEGITGSYYEVSYPDGRRAFILRNEATPFGKWNEQLMASQQSLSETAKTMMGIPYLWGGTSTKGVDCSGFTKTVFFMNGMIIPRDASQQVHAGVKVDDEKEWDKLQVGDLLFFGSPATESRDRRVVHVGMWIGNNQFIHSSRHVRISSVDSTSSDYDSYNVGRYLEARRYLENTEGNIIQTMAMYDELK